MTQRSELLWQFLLSLFCKIIYILFYFASVFCSLSAFSIVLLKSQEATQNVEHFLSAASRHVFVNTQLFYLYFVFCFFCKIQMKGRVL